MDKQNNDKAEGQMKKLQINQKCDTTQQIVDYERVKYI